jgi:hypothetical protein
LNVIVTGAESRLYTSIVSIFIWCPETPAKRLTSDAPLRVPPAASPVMRSVSFSSTHDTQKSGFWAAGAPDMTA